VTLPANEAGLKFRFVMNGDLATTDLPITSAEVATMTGVLTVAGAVVLAADEDNIAFDATTADVGDFIEVEADGSLWFVHGVGGASGSITANT
jgi:hypothetical protein